MESRSVVRVVVTGLAMLAGPLAAVPAEAGGVGDVLSPAFGNGCANQHSGASAQGTAPASASTGGGNVLGVPAGSPLNHCGGADVDPLLLLDSGTNSLLGGGGLPLTGSDLDPVTHMVGVGDLPKQVPTVGPLAGPVLDGLPLA